MGLLDWLRGRGRGATGGPDDAAVHDAIERVMQTTNPRLRLVRHYEQRLAPAAEAAMRHIADVVAAVPPARQASAAGWSADPYMRAFFATADDLKRTFSRANDLRAHFDKNPDDTEAYVVLSMEMSERRMAGMALHGDVVHRDVPQTALIFGDYRLRVCGRTEDDLREEIGRRLIDQLALEGLARAAADKTQRALMEQERALLKARLQLLERQGAGMRSMLGGDGVTEQSEAARLQAQLDENTHNLDSLGVGAESLDREFERIREALVDAGQLFCLSPRRLRLDRMNVVQGDDSAGAGDTLDLQTVRVPGDPPLTRTVALTRFARADLLPAGLMFDEAARLLL